MKPERRDAAPKRSVEQNDAQRGRQADKPTDIPKGGWMDIGRRVWQQLNEDNLSIVAAGVAFYGFVSVVPALAATIAIYALIADPSQVREHLALLTQVLPREVMPLIEDQLTRLTSNNQAAGLSIVISLAIAAYSSASATKALITGLNIAYDEEERRGFIKLSFVALVLTIAAIVGAAAVLALIAVVPSVLNSIGLASGSEHFLNILRWPLLFGLFIFGLAVLYRFGPSREAAKWRWVTWGAFAATLLWLVGSAIFSLYVSKFGSYDKTYGSLGAVVVFLFWLYLTAFVVLLGAELNSEMERQTAKDTTEGSPKGMGQRGAYAADTVGPSNPQK